MRIEIDVGDKRGQRMDHIEEIAEMLTGAKVLGKGEIG